jgi:hypothetical protein
MTVSTSPRVSRERSVGQIQVQRLGRGDEKARRPAQQRLALGRGAVAGSHADRDRRRLVAELARHLGDLGQRLLEVGVDVDREGLERAQINDLCAPADGAAALVTAIQRVDRGEEAGQRLAGAGGGADQRVVSTDDGRPALGLGRGRALRKASCEPCPHSRMKGLEDA